MVSKKNPFRRGSGLSLIFEYMKDGERYHLIGIAAVKYGCPELFLLKGDCRRAASALRAIRATLGLWVEFKNHTYQMSDSPI